MQKIIGALTFAAVAIALAGPAHADQTLIGSNGQPYNPADYGQTIIGYTASGYPIVETASGNTFIDTNTAANTTGTTVSVSGTCCDANGQPFGTFPDTGNATSPGVPASTPTTPTAPAPDTSAISELMQRGLFDTNNTSYFPDQIYTSDTPSGQYSEMVLESLTGAKTSIFGQLTGGSSGIASTSNFVVEGSPLSWLPAGSTISVTDYFHLIDLTSVSSAAVDIPTNLDLFGVFGFDL